MPLSHTHRSEPMDPQIPRRYKRFNANLPVTVLTSPVPPAWIPLRFQGETLDIGRGGMSVQFGFDVSRFLYRTKSVRIVLGHTEPMGTHHVMNARVVWENGDCLGFEFTRILRGFGEVTRAIDGSTGTASYQDMMG